mgnify:CR=1 FL=1
MVGLFPMSTYASARTKRHIHAVKLTLPKIPDNVSPTLGAASIRAVGTPVTRDWSITVTEPVSGLEMTVRLDEGRRRKKLGMITTKMTGRTMT